MSVTIPDSVLRSARMTDTELREELAVFLFEKDKLTLGQASRLAQMEQSQFLHLLSSRGIEVHYGIDEFEQDLDTLRRLGRL
jgi:predicted HTH domain antitoxin